MIKQQLKKTLSSTDALSNQSQKKPQLIRGKYLRKKSKDSAVDPASVIGPHDFPEKDFHDAPTPIDYAQIIALMTALPAAVSYDFVWHHVKFLGGSQVKPPQEVVWQTVMDYFSRHCSWRQLRILVPLRPLRLELQSMNVKGLPGFNVYFGGEDYSARWLCEFPSRSPHDPVILYMHGGSYALKLQRPQLMYMAKLAIMLAPYRVSILVLDYTVGPYKKFPTQLNEGMACYRDLKKTCDKILAFGDSAGGHLALTMLLSGARFEGGLALLSPTTDLSTKVPDDVSMRKAFVDETKHDVKDPLISPIYADPAVWPEVLPRNTAIVWGEVEESKEQMIKWSKLAKVEARFEEPQGSHDCMLRGTRNAGTRYIQEQLFKWFEEGGRKQTTPVDADLEQAKISVGSPEKTSSRSESSKLASSRSSSSMSLSKKSASSKSLSCKSASNHSATSSRSPSASGSSRNAEARTSSPPASSQSTSGQSTSGQSTSGQSTLG